MKTKKIKPYHVTEQICNPTKGIFKQTKYYNFNGKKFRIHFEHSNGSSLGFNHKKCISILDETTNKWNAAHDITELSDIKVESYYSPRCENSMEEFFTKEYFLPSKS